MPSNLPSGTVTFLFTDIEGSTKLAQEHPDAWESSRARHHAILRAAIEMHRGVVFQVVGDAVCSAFQTLSDGLQAAVEAQRDLQAEAWKPAPIRVRMGIHTGEAQWQDDEYVGYITLVRAQRVMSAAYGGQILVSNSSAELLKTSPQADMSLLDMGEHNLKSLSSPERLWQIVSTGIRQDFPPLASLRAIPNNLPLELTSFVGRETEIGEVRALLQAHRLVTLTGAGGTGKTRLAIRVASDSLDQFADGVWLIELAPLSDPVLVPNAVAAALSVREQQGRPLMETLLEWLGRKRLLLVLDNCEHLIAASAEFADKLLHVCRAARILATSREGLGIAGEMVYVVPSLESPPLLRMSQIPLEEIRQYTSVRLFTERAKDSLSTFSLTAANAPAVAQICSRLDGIPLAIELAAARVKVLHVEQIAERLNDRFRLLTGGSRTALPRHQTLRSLIDWSYSLLSEPERLLLRRLSVFASGWTLEAAEQVCAGGELESHETLDVLTHLVDKSLVQVEHGADETRYRMLETIRQYAREKLVEMGELSTISTRHLSFMLALAEMAQSKFDSLEEPAWFDRLQLEMGNLRVALERGLEVEDPGPVLRLSGCLYMFWWLRGFIHEPERWLTDALARPGAEKPTKERARALTALGWLRGTSGDQASTYALFDEGVRISRELGDQMLLAECLSTWCPRIAFAGSATAGPILEESLSLSRGLNYRLGMAKSLIGYGELQIYQGQDEAAKSSYEQCAALLREMGDRNFLAYVLRRQAHIELRQGNERSAIALCGESMRLNLDQRVPHGVAACLAAFGSIAARQGNALRAARLYGATSAAIESFGGKLVPIDETENEPYIRAARAAVAEDEYDRAFFEGRALSSEDAIAYALQGQT